MASFSSNTLASVIFTRRMQQASFAFTRITSIRIAGIARSRNHALLRFRIEFESRRTIGIVAEFGSSSTDSTSSTEFTIRADTTEVTEWSSFANFWEGTRSSDLRVTECASANMCNWVAIESFRTLASWLAVGSNNTHLVKSTVAASLTIGVADSTRTRLMFRSRTSHLLDQRSETHVEILEAIDVEPAVRRSSNGFKF